MKTAYIVIFTGYVCFGVGMLLGQALAQKPVTWIITLILVGLACVGMLIPLHKPSKKKLPRRRRVTIIR